MRAYWFWRPTGETADDGRMFYEVAHTTRGDVVALTDPCNVRYAARLCNMLNRIDGYTDAPPFDETTGDAVIAD